MGDVTQAEGQMMEEQSDGDTISDLKSLCCKAIVVREECNKPCWKEQDTFRSATATLSPGGKNAMTRLFGSSFLPME